ARSHEHIGNQILHATLVLIPRQLEQSTVTPLWTPAVLENVIVLVPTDQQDSVVVSIVGTSTGPNATTEILKLRIAAVDDHDRGPVTVQQPTKKHVRDTNQNRVISTVVGHSDVWHHR